MSCSDHAVPQNTHNKTADVTLCMETELRESASETYDHGYQDKDEGHNGNQVSSLT